MADEQENNTSEEKEEETTDILTEVPSLRMLLDVNLEVSVELGRSKMLIKELLDLNEGSVVELAKLAGEPLDILVNNKLVARGEAVVVNEKFGIRLTDIITPAERLEKLK